MKTLDPKAKSLVPQREFWSGPIFLNPKRFVEITEKARRGLEGRKVARFEQNCTVPPPPDLGLHPVA